MAIVVFLGLLSILIIVHEIGHCIIAKRLGVRVEKFSLGFGPRLFGINRGDTEYALCLVPLGGYVKMAGDDRSDYKGQPYEYLSYPTGKRALIVFFGPLLNYLLAFFCFCAVYFLGYPTLTSRVGKLLPGYPAQAAGIQEGDRIIAIDGTQVSTWEEVTKIVHPHHVASLRFTVERNRERLEFAVVPRREKLEGMWGQKEEVSLVGIQPSEEIVKLKYGPLESVRLGSLRFMQLTAITFKAIWKICTGGLSFKESVTGPLGIYFITAKASALGWGAILHVMGVLSLSLSIFNLLPLPVLDGGHLLFLFLERISGKGLSPKLEEAITRLGVSLLLILALFIFYNDMVRFGLVDKVVSYWQAAGGK